MLSGMFATDKNLSRRKRKFKREFKNQIRVQKPVEIIEPERGDIDAPILRSVVILKLLLSARFLAVFWSNISDCDETFNYWEPLHFVLYDNGMQTWEYSPEYALRSYMYIMVHAVPAFLFQKVFLFSPVTVFYVVRLMLAMLCALSEFLFLTAIRKVFGTHIAILATTFQTFSPGMFIASVALLPSSWCMVFSTAAYATWMFRKYEMAIFLTALSAFLGWPFSALLGVPIAIDMLLIRRYYRTFLLWSLISCVTILIPMVVLDSLFYGRLVVAPWNIVKYNVFGNHGPNLYGVEPLSYYLHNGFLNFNIAWIFSFLTPLLIVLPYNWLSRMCTLNPSSKSIPLPLLLMPLYLWMLVFFVQPHKEERFLFPIYPLISLHAAISIGFIQKIWGSSNNRVKINDYLDQTKHFMYVFVTLFVFLGASRILAVYFNFHAPVDLMIELNSLKMTSTTEKNVCFGQDWYRSPPSFFLPNTNWRLKIIQSEFTGMLPVPYTETKNSTQIVHEYFNDRNIGNSSQLYFIVEKCNFLLYFDNGKHSEFEPRYHLVENWRIMSSIPFINLEKSNRFFRSFYIPFLSDIFVKYDNFYLLEKLKS